MKRSFLEAVRSCAFYACETATLYTPPPPPPVRSEPRHEATRRFALKGCVNGETAGRMFVDAVVSLKRAQLHKTFSACVGLRRCRETRTRKKMTEEMACGVQQKKFNFT